MDRGAPSYRLAGSEIHGFVTLADLDVEKIMLEASKRWFRPNEVHAILSNYTLFKIQPQLLTKPQNGTVLLFDRKMLRYFRNDGHNWKKKKDGRTVQEAHEKLKVGNDEKIHVYYARGEDNSDFYRRCYWLLDKKVENIVLVHYRQTSKDNLIPHVPTMKGGLQHDSPSTLGNSQSGSAHSDLSSTVALSEEISSKQHSAIFCGSEISSDEKYVQIKNHEQCLHDINTLEWGDLLLLETPPPHGDPTACVEGFSSSFHKHDANDSLKSDDLIQPDVMSEGLPSMLSDDITYCGTFPDGEASLAFENANMDLQFDFNASNMCSKEGSELGIVIQNDYCNQSCSQADQPPAEVQVFSITDMSPAWAYSTEEAKVLVVGSFHETFGHLVGSEVYFVFGGRCTAAEMVQSGVDRCTALPHVPGVVDFYMTLDGHTPISQIMSFEYRSVAHEMSGAEMILSEDGGDNFKWELRIALLLFSTVKIVPNNSSRLLPNASTEAKRQNLLSLPFETDWNNLLKLSNNNEISPIAARKLLFEIIVKNKLQERLLENADEGARITSYDHYGQGLIHLCAILDYPWAVDLFSFSDMSLDFRDSCGWTALHWAAYHGRENMVVTLLSAGANPSLVTDPTPDFPGGHTAADLASKQGFEGLAAYLAEKGLNAHFEAMTLSGNMSASVQLGRQSGIVEQNAHLLNLSEQELCLKESLAAYRNAADAADRIHAALQERSLWLREKAVQSNNPLMEAESIISAMKIQHAYRNHSRRKMMKAAAQIQGCYRSWKTRKKYLYMRKKAIKIQAVFRGHQVRRHYCKIIWSVGVLEKALLRWRMKRKGLRDIQSQRADPIDAGTPSHATGEEDFFRIGREQAEERITRSVVLVQSMFRSYRAQQQYQRMKLAQQKQQQQQHHHHHNQFQQ